MLILKVHLKTALDLANGPLVEKIEFNTFEDIKSAFKFFPQITITTDRVLKDGIPVGEIIQGAMND